MKRLAKLSKRLASLTTGLMIMGAALLPHSAKAQGTPSGNQPVDENINASGSLPWILDPSSGITNGSFGSFATCLNSADLTVIGGGQANSGVSTWSSTDPIYEGVNGTSTKYDNLQYCIYIGGTDFSGNNIPVDVLEITCGQGNLDGIIECFPEGTITTTTEADLVKLVNMGLTGTVPNLGDDTITVANSAEGPINTFQVQPAPEPGSVALLGTGGIVAGTVMYMRNRRKKQSDLSPSRREIVAGACVNFEEFF